MKRNAAAMATIAAFMALIAPPVQHFDSSSAMAAPSSPAEHLAESPSRLGQGLPESESSALVERAHRDESAALAHLILELCRQGETEPATLALPATVGGSSAPPVKGRKTKGTPGAAHDLRTAVSAGCKASPEFIVALVPDPLHTRLGLLFDRAVEVIEEATQDAGYLFVKAVMPWDHERHPESADPSARLADRIYTSARTDLPGLMTFRHDQRPPLLVAIVGESPTGGINKPQFLNALRWMRAISNSPPAPVRILGPTFSGSLASLAQLLTCNSPLCDGSALVYSGSITDRNAVDTFRRTARAVAFESFQEADDVLIRRFTEFLTGTAYGPPHQVTTSIAILSEDETEYGLARQPQTESSEQGNHSPTRLFFPREISRLRGAYQDTGAKEHKSEWSSGQHNILPLTLELSGSEDDTIPAFSKQAALSQEGVLLGIVSELRKHGIEYILLRATDPIDLLFLSRYLTAAYPRGKVVTLGADLLFRREVEDKQLHGILALSTYSLAPASDHPFYDYLQHDERVFPSSTEAGLYNALHSLLVAAVSVVAGHAGGPGPTNDTATSRDRTDNPYLYQYGWLESWRQHPDDPNGRKPPVHLLALGRDEYWPIAHLGHIAYEPPSLLHPAVHAQFLDSYQTTQPLQFTAIAWTVAEILAVALACSFLWLVWCSSIFSSSQPAAQLAPAFADGRSYLVAFGGLTIMSILLLLLHTMVPTPDYWQIEHWPIPQAVLWTALALVMIATVWDAFSRFPDAQENGRHDALRAHLLFVTLSLLLVVAWCMWTLFFNDHLTGQRRFEILRSLHLASWLSPTLPVLFCLAALLWWIFHECAGSALLDDRRPRLPKGVKGERVRLIVEECDGGGHDNFIVTHLLEALPLQWPTLRHGLLIVALVLGGFSLLAFRWQLMALEDRGFNLVLLVLSTLSFLLIVGTTLRLWDIWLKTRRLLVSLDSRPLRRGFERLEGFTWKPLWRVGLVSMTEFQLMVARLGEALTVADNSTDLRLTDQLASTSDKRKAIRDHMRTALSLRPWSKERRSLEREIIKDFHAIQEATARAAGVALDFLAASWLVESEGPKRWRGRETPHELGVRAAERFVCLVYVSFLLIVLVRIRTLVMAIGGMYIFMLLALTSYPFAARTTIDTLLALLLAGIVLVVTLVFAQMHRNDLLSRLTNTKPGELGSDFWIRTASFAALPLLSFLAAQFPEINRMIYSWFEPAVQALHK